MIDRAVEQERLEALAGYAVLDTDPEPDFDRIARLAANIFSAPIALICFADDQRHWFKARIGVDLTETPRAEAFCAVTIEQDEVCMAPDVRLDPRFIDNPLLYSSLNLRFYAGAPLIGPKGHRLGTLCVLDHKPRPEAGPREAEILADLAATVVAQLELRRERRAQFRPAQDIALVNEILTVLAETSSMRQAIDETMDRVMAAIGACCCSLIENREGDDNVQLVTVRAGGGRALKPYADMLQDLPLPRKSIVVSSLFTHDGETETGTFGAFPATQYPAVRRLQALGIDNYAALSLHVGGHRFVLTVHFEGVRSDLDDIAALLRRLNRSIRPVLQRKLAEERLDLVSSALAATQDAVIITEVAPVASHGSRIVFTNAGFTRMTGWRAEEVMGLTPHTFLAPEADPAEMDRIRAAMRSWQPVQSELLNRRRDGTTFWAELTMSPLADAAGQHTHWVIVQRDVTERRATAGELRRVTDELVAANRIARLGTWRWMVGTAGLIWSREVYRMFGADPDDFVLTLDTWLALIHPEDRERIAERLAWAARQKTEVEFECRTVEHGGIVRHIRCEGVCAFDADGTVRSIHGFCQDITERKQAEAVVLRTEKLNSIGQLTGGIAHDFNNLLTVISLNLEIASDMLGEDHPAFEMLRPAIQAANSGAQLTSSLLSFARRQPLRPRPIDVNELVGEIRQLALRTLGERYHLTLDLEAAAAICLLDRAQFESAMLNLLVNSRDAMRDGGVIRLVTENVLVGDDDTAAPADLAPGRYVRVTVTDTGIGIAPELQERVFEPFFTTKSVGKGTGLGLSMVMGFVRQSGGQVELSSQPGQGTTVRLYLPTVVQPEPQMAIKRIA